MALQVGQFAVAGIVTLALVGLGTSIAARRIGQREAITEARATAATRGEGLVSPALRDGILTGDPAARQAVADVVRLGVLDTSLVRVKLWTPSGTIVYSDEPRLVGSTFTLGADELAAIRTGTIDAKVSDLAEPENRFERQFGRLLEVYLPVYTPSNQPLLFEAYFRYGAVSSAGSRLWRSFAPISLGALLLLELVQVPLAWSLARRLRQRVREREALLQRALQASEVERRRIARDLHDGVVQDLAGTAYALAASSRRVGDPAHAAELQSSSEQVRGSIQALRSLLVDLYPPNLADEGLESALGDLLASARARGLEASLDAGGLDRSLPLAATQLLYRAAQEAVRNVLQHAGARSLAVRVTTTAADGRARLVVTDDGRGFDPAEAGRRAAEGHLGLRGLEGLLAEAGGGLKVTSAPGHGTTVEAEVTAQ